jgi:hypothetical protein
VQRPHDALATLVGAALAAALWLGAVRGQAPPEGLPAPAGQPPAEGHPHGGPPPVAWWAIPTRTPAYIGYYVGGGCACARRGEPRYPCEGTWGWDFTGRCFLRKVDLRWWHGRRYQGGVGAYEPEGPEPLKRLHEGADEGH